MITSLNKYDAIENLIYLEGLKISSLTFNAAHDKMLVQLANHFVLVVPIYHYSSLKDASVRQLDNFRLIGQGTGIHWPELDEDLSLKGLLNELLRQMVTQKEELLLS